MKVKALNVGSCNGCDIELWAGAVEAGWELVQDPAQADVLVITGSLTAKNAQRLRAFQDQAPPRPVLLIGTCAISQHLFEPAAEDLNQFEFLDLNRLTVVFGCPPSPLEIVRAWSQPRIRDKSGVV
ncbi:MAG: hypothetical protein JRJ59_03805 [Deltaproteobacteria bacterium]|nr:hypothetical protein [Deltaproteobacteria bacterium]